MPRLAGSCCRRWRQWRSKPRSRRSGCTENNRKIRNASWTWNCSRPATRQAWPSVATPPAILTIVSLPHSWRRTGRPRSGMAGRWSDEHIAASLNRMGLPTGQGKTWTAHRVASVRRVRGIHAYRSAEKDGEWLTMTEAAKVLGVTNHAIRRLIKAGVLPAVQVVPGAPHQIRADDLASEPVKTAVARKGRPCRVVDADTLPMFTDT